MRLGIVTKNSLEFIVNPSLSIEISLAVLSDASRGTELKRFLKFTILTKISAPELKAYGKERLIWET